MLVPFDPLWSLLNFEVLLFGPCSDVLSGVSFATGTWGRCVVKLVSEYLERAVRFTRMAAEASDPKLKESLENQALAYRKLADKRAAQLKLPPVNLPAVLPKGDGPP